MDIEELHRVVVQGFASVTDRLDSGLTAVNQRIDALQIHMDADFGRVKDALMEHGRQLKDIRVALDRKVDRDELEARH
jgi:hypothetical protein